MSLSSNLRVQNVHCILFNSSSFVRSLFNLKVLLFVGRSVTDSPGGNFPHQ